MGNKIGADASFQRLVTSDTISNGWYDGNNFGSVKK